MPTSPTKVDVGALFGLTETSTVTGDFEMFGALDRVSGIFTFGPRGGRASLEITTDGNYSHHVIEGARVEDEQAAPAAPTAVATAEKPPEAAGPVVVETTEAAEVKVAEPTTEAEPMTPSAPPAGNRRRF